MTESVLSNQLSKSNNRLDPAHDLLTSSPDAVADEPANPWMAYAGRDPEQTTQQVDRQASELLSYVQEQNKEIDVRQAELNAKLAQLDNQLRNARLRSVEDNGTDLLNDSDSKASNSMLDSGVDLGTLDSQANDPPPTAPARQEAHPGYDGITVADLVYVQEEVTTRVSHYHQAHVSPDASDQEFEEVERLVAQFSDADVSADEPPIEDLWNHDPGAHFSSVDENAGSAVAANAVDAIVAASPKVATVKAPADAPEAAPETREKVDAFPSLLAGSHLRRLDAVSLEATDSLDSERRILADRKLELDRQKSVVSRMQEETQALHREALEMRLVTEQLWGQMSETTPPEKLKGLIASLRSRLDEQYSKELASLDERKSEMVSMQSVLADKQTSLREQSHRMQDWFTGRQEEIKAYANEVDARAMLLDRREQRLQDEFAKWESQRIAYDQQLQGLAKKLKLNGISM